MIQIEEFRRRNLPHWDPPGATFFVTSCLDGSIPAEGLLDIAHYRTWFDERKTPPGMEVSDWNHQKSKLVYCYIDDWLDNRPAVRHFTDESLAQIVVDSMRHFAGIRYDLWAFVVMPSHFHWVFQPLDAWVKTLVDDNRDRTPRKRIMQGVKTYTAIECNRLLKRTGRFWQQESYDHVARDIAELDRIIAYVERNPVQAGHVTEPANWRFSSAFLRAELGIPDGRPLPGPELGR